MIPESDWTWNSAAPTWSSNFCLNFSPWSWYGNSAKFASEFATVSGTFLDRWEVRMTVTHKATWEMWSLDANIIQMDIVTLIHLSWLKHFLRRTRQHCRQWIQILVLKALYQGRFRYRTTCCSSWLHSWVETTLKWQPTQRMPSLLVVADSASHRPCTRCHSQCLEQNVEPKGSWQT